MKILFLLRGRTPQTLMGANGLTYYHRFHCSTQPLFYLMNDILVESSKPHACGSPCLSIDQIEGRVDDIIELSSNDMVIIKLKFSQMFFIDLSLKSTLL
jgi:hypothetical protein